MQKKAQKKKTYIHSIFAVLIIFVVFTAFIVKTMHIADFLLSSEY